MEYFALSEAETHKIIAAVSEAVTNVMCHGYKSQLDRPIWIRLDPIAQGERSGVKIVIEDEAECVDVSTIRGRPLDEVRPDGLGIHIIRQAMDEVEYLHRPSGQGMCLTMTKFTKPAEPARIG